MSCCNSFVTITLCTFLTAGAYELLTYSHKVLQVNTVRTKVIVETLYSLGIPRSLQKITIVEIARLFIFKYRRSQKWLVECLQSLSAARVLREQFEESECSISALSARDIGCRHAKHTWKPSKDISGALCHIAICNAQEQRILRITQIAIEKCINFLYPQDLRLIV